MSQPAPTHTRAATLFLFALAAGFLLVSVKFTIADFRVTSVNRTNNDVRVTWTTPGASNYVLQSVSRLGTNFTDVSPVIYVPGAQSTGYTHVGGSLNVTSRFYRVRSFPAPGTLRIYPTNVTTGLTMTNRYKVVLINPDNSTQDVTAAAALTSSNGVAVVLGVSDGFWLVRGNATGTGSLRAVYQGQTNTANLTVSTLTAMYTVPPLTTIVGYVGGSNPPVKVMGIFANGQTNNITPASELAGGVSGVSRVDYSVTADVANSFALITGQSAAAGDSTFTAAGVNTLSFSVSWCFYTSISLVPSNPVLLVGQTQSFTVLGQKSDGSFEDVLSNSFGLPVLLASSDPTVAQTNLIGLSVTALNEGTTTLHVNANNGPGTDCSAGLDTYTTLTVVTPPVITNQPGDQMVNPGGNTAFSVSAAGSPPLTFQWRTNGVNLAGATNNILNISNATVAQQASYRVIITNMYGSVTSSVAVLAVVPAGQALWTNSYNGPGNSDDYAYAMAVDTNASGGIVFVGGAAGTSDESADFATIKYTGAGGPLWTNRYNGPGNSYDNVTAMAVDSGGNVVVTGPASVSGGTYDYVTLKYSAAGLPLWTNRYNGPGNNYDAPAAVAVDSNNAVCVTGYSYDSSGYPDYATLKYSSAGVPLWTNRYNGPGNFYDYPTGIALDNSGNVLVTGGSFGAGFYYDFATVKYSSAGVPLWTNRYNGSGNGSAYAKAIGVDNTGNVFVTGYSDTGTGATDFATVKYSSSGTPLWTNLYSGPAGSDYPTGLAMDSSGNVIVTGYSIGNGSNADFVTIKYSGTGLPLWTNRYNGPGNSIDLPSAIAVDSENNVAITGQSVGTSGHFDYATIKYSSTGVPLWISRFSGYGGSDAYVQRTVMDTSGNVYVTGGALLNNTNTDLVTIKYAASPP